jgi:asparagine synthase (glutamine-hydrolysing)
MPAICGLVGWSRQERPISRLSSMLAPLGYRPGGGQQMVDQGICALGAGQSHATGAQRVAHAAGRVSAVLDGRLEYDHALRRHLGMEASASDVEVVVAAYANFGTDCFARLRGDFAIVLWDSATQQLVAARDVFAIRPLCYAVSADWFAVASDPEQMLAAGVTSSDPDDEMVIDYLFWDARFVNRTFFRNVHALEPSHFLIASAGGHRVERYRAPLSRVELPSRAAYESEYRHRFRASVHARVCGRAPVVAELSGGLDSSSIFCMADQIFREEPSICPSITGSSGLYPGLPCDEEQFIRAVERHVSLPVTVWNGIGATCDELERSSIALPGGRFATFGGADGQVETARAVGGNILLSGLGGDQVGTPSGALRDAVATHRWKRALHMILRRPDRSPQTVLGTSAALLRSYAPEFVRKVRASLPRLADDHYWLRRWVRLRPRPRHEIEPPVPLEAEVHRRTWRSVTSGAHVMMMMYAQHHAMRSGIDIRFPFLDMDLVALILSIPSRYWPPPWPYERLHRGILRDILPLETVARRSKAEFSHALTLRVRRHLPWIRDVFHSSGWRSDRYVDLAGARKLLGEFESQKTPVIKVTYAVWAIASTEAWLRAISDYTSARTRREPYA